MSQLPPFSNVCVIGTGARGIAACRALSERGVHFDCFERLDAVAGSLFEATTVAVDFDRPGRDDFREANDPCLCAIAEALETYVNRFGLRSRITFGAAVEYARRLSNGLWRVHFEQSPPREYDAIFVATGCQRRRLSEGDSDLLRPASLPFLDPEQRRVLSDGAPLWNHLIHPRFPNLFLLSRMPTVRLTISVAEEQSKFAAGYIAGDYELPTRSQMERDCRSLQRGYRKPSVNRIRAEQICSNQSRCPRSVSDTRYVFHLRSERVRRARLRHLVAGSSRAVSG